MPPRTKDPKLTFWVLGTFFVMLVLAIFHQQVNPWLAYIRPDVLNGQVWRLVTCHFVHLNLNHFLLDGSGFLLVWWIFRDVLTRQLFWLWAGISAPLCGLMLLLDSSLYSYVGISGILHGWLIIALLAGWKQNKLLHTLALVVVATKLVYEQSPFYNDEYLNGLIHGQVYATAHLDGSVIAIGIMAGVWLWQKPAR